MLAKLQEKLSHEGVLLSNNENEAAGKNLRYITGFTGSSGFALIGKDYAYFISDSRYTLQVAEQVSGFEYIERSGSVVSILNDLIKKHEIKEILFEQKIQYTEYKGYLDGLKDVVLTPAGQLVDSMREVKTEEELKLMKEACRIADEAFTHILGYIKPGISERSVALELESKMQQLGASKASFDIIVASGKRSALPHGVASDKIIQSGDFVTLDFGCYYKGYASDITRTLAVGDVDDALLEIYEIVKEAQRLGVLAVKAGVTGKEVDEACRDYITSKGYGQYFKHGTGHGLGLDVHETPSASPLNLQPLVAGNVITVEPGIYIPELGGVRIEDDVVVTETGSIILNESTKDLIRI